MRIQTLKWPHQTSLWTNDCARHISKHAKKMQKWTKQNDRTTTFVNTKQKKETYIQTCNKMHYTVKTRFSSTNLN